MGVAFGLLELVLQFLLGHAPLLAVRGWRVGAAAAGRGSAAARRRGAGRRGSNGRCAPPGPAPTPASGPGPSLAAAARWGAHGRHTAARPAASGTGALAGSASR